MCEILLCVKDMPDPAVTHRMPKAGDAIVVVDDGWKWGELELGGPHYTCAITGEQKHVSEHPNGNHAFWRILKFPKVSKTVASMLLSRELDSDPLRPTPYLQHRGHFIDKSKVTTELLAHWDDDSRVSPTLTLDIDEPTFVSFISARTPVAF